MSRFACLALVALSACFDSRMLGFVNPAQPRVSVQPRLSELPDSKRDAVIDSAQARPDAEQQKRDLKPKERKLLYGAAIGAAIIGAMFSKTKNTTIGLVNDFDETGQLQRMKKRPIGQDNAPNGTLAEEPKTDATQLLPWIEVKAPVDPAPVDPPAVPPAP